MRGEVRHQPAAQLFHMLASLHARMGLTSVYMQVLPNGHAARDYQDERFSYVVMARSPRPATSAAVAAVQIAPYLQGDACLQHASAVQRSQSALQQAPAEVWQAL